MSSSSSDEEQNFQPNKADQSSEEGETVRGTVVGRKMSSHRRIEDESSSETEFVNPARDHGIDENGDNADEGSSAEISQSKPRRRIIAMNDSKDTTKPARGKKKEKAVKSSKPTGKWIDSEIFDTEENLDDKSDESCGNPVPHHESKPIGKKTGKGVEKKKKNNAVEKRGKKVMDASEKRTLHSDSQRMFRETRFQLPRREPPQMTLAEFLEHRKKTRLPIPPVMKPTRAQLIKWLDSLEAPEAAGTSQTQSVPNADVENNTPVLTRKEQIRKVKEDALRSGFVPKLTSDTDTLVYLDREYKRGEGGLSEEAKKFKERLERKMDKPVPQLKLAENTSELVFDNDKGPKLLQLQKYLQVGIFKNRDERYAKKIAEYNLQNEKRMKEESEEELAEESLAKSEINEETEDKNGFVDDEAEDAEGGVKNSCEDDNNVHIDELKPGKSISEKCEDPSFEFIGSMIAPYQPQRAQMCNNQNESTDSDSLDDDDKFCASQDLFAASQPIDSDYFEFPKRNSDDALQCRDDGSELLAMCSGTFSDDGWNQLGNEDELLMLCSGNFPKSQIDANNVDPACDVDDNSNISNSSEPFVPQVTKAKGRVLYSDEESDAEPDVESQEDSEEYRHRFGPVPTEKPGNRRQEFLEEEAELSGSEASSDEDEDVYDDILEEELGDKDELVSEEELHDQVANIHRKIMLDEDKNNLILLKEQYLDYGDLDGGTERPRQFRWKNMGDEFVETAPPSEQLDEDSESEDDGLWRKEMHEREKWVEEQRLADEMKEMEKSVSKQIVPDDKDKIVVPKSGTSDLPKSPQKCSTAGLRGSFLHRGRDVLDRIAKMTEKGFQSTRPMNSRNFVFAHLSPKKDQKNKVPVKRTSDTMLNPGLPNKQSKRETSVAAPNRQIPRKSIFDQF